MKSDYLKVIEYIEDTMGFNKKASEKLFSKFLSNKQSSNKLIGLANLLNSISFCEKCGILTLSEESICDKCKDVRVNRILLVKSNNDFLNLDRKVSPDFGFYIFGNIPKLSSGVINESIIKFIDYLKYKKPIELIFSFPPSIESDYLFNLLKKRIETEGIKVNFTKIAIGIPYGGSTEYVDEETYLQSLKRRQ